MLKFASHIKIEFMPVGNRVVNQKAVKAIKESIQLNGILRQVILIRTNLFGQGNKYYIADGQHLYYACQSLNILKDLSYVICKRKFNNIQEIVEFVALLNATQTPWKLEEYVNAYASTNQFIDYNILISKRNKYNLSYQLLSMIYGGLSSITGPQMLKDGKFKIVNESKGDELAIRMQDICSIFGRTNTSILKEFAMAFYYWSNAVEYNHKKFIQYVIENKEKLSLLERNKISEILINYK